MRGSWWTNKQNRDQVLQSAATKDIFRENSSTHGRWVTCSFEASGRNGWMSEIGELRTCES